MEYDYPHVAHLANPDDSPDAESTARGSVLEIVSPKVRDQAVEVLAHLSANGTQEVSYSTYLAMMQYLGHFPTEAAQAFDVLGYTITSDMMVNFGAHTL